MIIYPSNWSYIYSKPSLLDIEKVMQEAVIKPHIPNLCLSGGIDSSLTLHFMAQVFTSVKCFTIVESENHPDYYYSNLIARKYGATHLIYVPSKREIIDNTLSNDLKGDVAVRLLYKFIGEYTNEIISTDCIDELDCGYYPHEQTPTDETFRRFISELEELHLRPLNKNSGKVKVYLPYATREVVNMFLKIPIAEKIRKQHIKAIASKYLPKEIIERRKYGFCSALEGISEET